MTDWRTRLIEKIDEDPRSDRRISLDAKVGVNAVNEIRNTAKKPSVDRVIRIAAEVKASLAYVFLGIPASIKVDEFVAALAQLPPSAFERFYDFLRELEVLSTGGALDPEAVDRAVRKLHTP